MTAMPDPGLPLTGSLAQIQQIAGSGLCHRCGSCSGICPTSVLQPGVDDFPAWVGRVEQCTDCGLCVKVCPGREFSYPGHYRATFEMPAPVETPHGQILQAFLGYANDPAVRGSAASGGLGTALPRYLLAGGSVRGVFRTKPDRAQPWRTRAYIARSEAELAAGASSRYAAASMNHLFGEIRRERGPFLFVGLPCQVHGVRTMSAANSGIGEKVGLTVGLFCHSCLDPEALRQLLSSSGIAASGLAEFTYRWGKMPSYWRGRTTAGKEVFLPYPAVRDGYRPNYKECLTFLFKIFSPSRCRMCLDGFSEFADIAIGDPYVRDWQRRGSLRQGYNLIFARTARGLETLRQAESAGAITLEPLTEAEARRSELPMIRDKRLRAFFTMERRRKAGRPVPSYHLEGDLTRRQRLKARIHVAGYYFADHPRLGRAVARFLFSPPGRFVVAAAFFRRRVLPAALARLRVRGHSGTDEDV